MAKSRSIGGIYASLSLRDGGFKSGLKSAKKSLTEFGNKAAMGASIGAGVAGAAMLAGTKRTLSMADDLGDLSAQTGVAIDTMMQLQQAYTMGGRAADMAGKDIGKMQKGIVGAAAGGDNPFASLGMDAKELIKLNPGEQFNKIGEAIMRMSNPAERTAKAMEIFGKGGMGLTTVFEGIPDATTALGKMPEIATEFAGRMGEANDLIGNLPLKSDQFFMGFTAGIVDAILPGLHSINEFDFTMLGKNLGDALTSPSIFEGIAADLNVLYDMATGQDSTGTGGVGDRYNEAQRDLDLADQLAAKMMEVEKIRKDKNKTINDFRPEDFAPPDSYERDQKARDEAFDANLKREEFYKDFLSGDAAAMSGPRDVNAYQARGLSLDGQGQVRAVETTNTLLGKIDRRLADMQKTGGLKF